MIHFKDYWDGFNIFSIYCIYGFAKVWQKTCFFDVGKEMVIFFDYSHLMKKNVYMVILTWKILCFQHLYNMWFSVFFWKTWNQSEAGWENPFRDQCEIWGNWWEYRYIWGFWIEKNLIFSWNIDIFQSIIHKW